MRKLSKTHLIGSPDLTLEDLNLIFSNAREFKENHSPRVKYGYLKDLPIMLVFSEPSTRTKLSFEIAATRLGADVLIFDSTTSSQSKGESFLDTLKTLESMGVAMFVVRHSLESIPKLLQENLNAPVINSGNGSKDHPTQGLLDAFVLQEKIGDLKGKRITIVGDLLNSRVARSNLVILERLGMEIAICCPDNMNLPYNNSHNLTHYENIDEALLHSDIIMLLRIQKERMAPAFDIGLDDYRKDFSMTTKRFENNKNILVMHPGPVNYGLELDAELYEKENCLISQQVSSGVFVRMAVLKLLGENIKKR